MKTNKEIDFGTFSIPPSVVSRMYGMLDMLVKKSCTIELPDRVYINVFARAHVLYDDVFSDNDLHNLVSCIESGDWSSLTGEEEINEEINFEKLNADDLCEIYSILKRIDDEHFSVVGCTAYVDAHVFDIEATDCENDDGSIYGIGVYEDDWEEKKMKELLGRLKKPLYQSWTAVEK